MLIILAWLAITVIMTIGVPPLEQVAKEHSVSLNPTDAPSFKAMKRMGEVFNESNSNSVAMIVLEGQQRLGDDVHQYYDSLIRQLKDDPHVKHIHDFWGDPLTAAAAESADGKAVFVQLDLTGTWAKPRQTNRPKPSKTSWIGHRRRRGSRHISPAPRRSLRIWGKVATVPSPKSLQ